MVQLLRELRKKVSIGFVGGSDLDKIKWQLEVDGLDGTHNLIEFIIWFHSWNITAIHDFDFAFAENGLTAYRLGKQLDSQSFIKYLGEDNYKYLVNFLLKYLSEIDIPIKRCVAFNLDGKRLYLKFRL
jgi:phosphomannomutase